MWAGRQASRQVGREGGRDRGRQGRREEGREGGRKMLMVLENTKDVYMCTYSTLQPWQRELTCTSSVRAATLSLRVPDVSTVFSHRTSLAPFLFSRTV